MRAVLTGVWSGDGGSGGGRLKRWVLALRCGDPWAITDILQSYLLWIQSYNECQLQLLHSNRGFRDWISMQYYLHEGGSTGPLRRKP